MTDGHPATRNGRREGGSLYGAGTRGILEVSTPSHFTSELASLSKQSDLVS